MLNKKILNFLSNFFVWKRFREPGQQTVTDVSAGARRKKTTPVVSTKGAELDKRKEKKEKIFLKERNGKSDKCRSEQVNSINRALIVDKDR